MITDHFVITKMPALFRVGETIRARRNASGDVVGLDKVVEVSGLFVEALVGYVADREPLDVRTRMPISIDGVQLWRGYDTTPGQIIDRSV